MRKAYGLPIYRLVFGYMAITAVVMQLILGLKYNNLNVVNFFSYFTILSNILAAFVFIVMGKAALLGINLKKRALFRGAAVLYMAITGIVYALLLSGLDVQLGISKPWINVVLHYLMPIAIVVDWLFDPPWDRIPFRSALVWTIFPLVYVAYSLIRGALTDWYPYPFLDPDKHGYGGVAVVVAGIFGTSLLLIWIISHAAGRKNRTDDLQKKPRPKK